MYQHTFVICAYKESKYLEQCIRSLIGQTVKSQIIMVTSTPNDYIYEKAEKYKIPLFVNEGEKGIAGDWNFGYQCAKTPLVTIAHQDDEYFDKYTEEMLKCIQNEKKALIYFSNYAEIRNGSIIKKSSLLRIKRMMLIPLKIKKFGDFLFIKRRILSLGNPICCPAVTFVVENLPTKLFRTGFRSNVDWETWEMISRRKGSFIYNKTILMGHRIHEESETSNVIKDNERVKEDYQMFCKFWPKYIAKILTKVYANGEKFNEV